MRQNRPFIFCTFGFMTDAHYKKTREDLFKC